jgi:DNA-directed RNA polymerase subunit RPC12/RpoP
MIMWRVTLPEIPYTVEKGRATMDRNSWFMLFSRALSFGFVAFMGFFFLGNMGWLLAVFVGFAAAAWWRSEKRGYQCPECKKYFYREYLDVQIIEKEGWLKGGTAKFTYKCKQCGHEWKRLAMTPSVWNLFLNG